MHRSLIFRLFPPPKLMTFDHVGIDISDDGIHALKFKEMTHGLTISHNVAVDFPTKIIEGGEILDPIALGKYLNEVQKKINARYVKVSIPEEKGYLFLTDVPNLDTKSIYQNIESKLEENIPLSVNEAVFYYDLFPHDQKQGTIKASVSVVPRSYVEQLNSFIEKAGMIPIAFEITPRAIARSSIAFGIKNTVLIIHNMNNKVGFYITCEGVVCFSSTITYPLSANALDSDKDKISSIRKELDRIYSYWGSHGLDSGKISRIEITGKGADDLSQALHGITNSSDPEISVSNVWNNVFDLDKYTPILSRKDSFEFAVASGLALVL